MIDESVPKPHEDHDVKELRLALVCYGGVSLAIYMHGVTKEIHRLVRASEKFYGNPAIGDLDPGEQVYFDALERCMKEDGVQTRVVVDVIAGTSAGGINGICLAKALANNLSQDALKTLWIEHGDIGGLVPDSNPKRFVGALSKWLGASDERAWQVGAGWQLLRRKPVLNGEQMSRWLYDAFKRMDATPGATGTLVPDDLALELFVPMTDFHGYEREFPIESPAFIRDRTHRHVMAFRRDASNSHFTAKYNHALAFAARATSSFPAAFEPITFEAYGGAVDEAEPEAHHKAHADLGGCANDFFKAYEANHADGSKAYFVDGGVLNNYPFAPAITAIQRKPAAGEVERRLIYIEPDPQFSDGRITESNAGEQPTLIKTALGAYAGIPSNQPIIDELMRLDERNRNVRRVRDVIEASFDKVQQLVTELLAKEQVDVATLFAPSGQRIADLAAKIAAAARERADLNYATYARLRRATLTDAYAALLAEVCEFPEGSYQAAFIAGALREFVMPTRRPDEADDGSSSAARTAEIDSVLARLDLDYHERRLRFVIAALSWWYRDPKDARFSPGRRDLDRAKGLLYETIVKIQGLARGVAQTQLGQQALVLFKTTNIQAALKEDDPFGTFVARHRDVLNGLKDTLEKSISDEKTGVVAIEEAMYQELLKIGSDWEREAKARLVVRYLGFAYWDILVYPIQALAGVGERDHVEVIRFSPRDAKFIVDPDDKNEEKKNKLKGVALAHFGAFLKQSYRENDYLWGRLDAAELLLDLVERGARPPSPGRAAREAPPEQKLRMLAAIVAQETSREGSPLAQARDEIKFILARLVDRHDKLEAELARGGEGETVLEIRTVATSQATRPEPETP